MDTSKNFLAYFRLHLLAVWCCHLATTRGHLANEASIDTGSTSAPNEIEELCERSGYNPLEHLVYPDVSDCRAYYYCHDGHAHREMCRFGLYYNQLLQACDVDRTQRCNQQQQQQQQQQQITESEQPFTLPLTTTITWSPTRGDSVIIPTVGDIDADVDERYNHVPPPQQEEPVLMLEDRISRMLQQQKSHIPVEIQKRQQVEPRSSVEVSWQSTDSGPRDTHEWRMEHLLITGEEVCRTRGSGAFSHPHECRGYVVCTSTGPTSPPQTHPGLCPIGLVFSELIRSCDFDVTERCRSDEDTGTADGATSRRQSTSASTNSSAYGASGISQRVQDALPSAIDGAMTSLLDNLQREADIVFARRSERNSSSSASATSSGGTTRPFHSVQQFLRAKPLARQLGLSAFILTAVTRDLIKELGLSVDDAISVLRSLRSPLPSSSSTVSADDPTVRRPDPGTCPWPTYRCDVLSKYRSFDGSCNNLDNPIRGRSFTPFARYLPQAYNDGVQKLRARQGDNQSLPSARLVSYTINEDRDLPHHIQSLWVMVWGQFIDHDLSLTALSKDVVDPSGYGETVDIECGTDGCSADRDECQPITIPPNDPAFVGKKCLEFVRSQPVPNLNCTMGPREQLNQLTSFVDASMVYGSTKEEADKLRDLTKPNRGQLRYNANPNNSSYKYLLPTTDKALKQCRDFDAEHQCFLAGDDRVNEQSVLAVMHTLWLREHNRIEEELFRINPQWSGQTLFQETRRIIGAMMQHITYSEFLPVVLGPAAMKQYELELLSGTQYYNGYNSSIDASVKNVFATAAMRFGHTLLPSSIGRANSEYQRIPGSQTPLSQMLNRPRHIYNTLDGGMDSLLRGMLGQPIQQYDRFVSAEVTVHLFADNPPTGLGTDLVSLNVQRGRDHGIPGYIKWRQFCGLPIATTFEQLQDIVDADVRAKFKSIYRHVNDIDLFPAAIAERSLDGALVGPTFACILGRQFQDLRQGDRYWYENSGPFQFTPDQLAEIRKVTLAKVICINSDNVTTIQPNVMQLPFREAYPNKRYAASSGLSADWFAELWRTDFNARVDCNSPCLPELNISKWKTDAV